MDQNTLNALLVPILTALAAFISAYLYKLTADIKAKSKNRELDKYIGIAEDAIATAVQSTMQTYVDSIKGTSEWNAEAQKKAFEDAKFRAISIMGLAAQKAIGEAFGDANAWIENKIEAFVGKYKK